MSQNQTSSQQAALEIQNIGGITESTIELTPPVSILAGRNATNRTSLLQALMAALGSKNATLKGDTDEGQVKLTIGEREYTRRLRREGSDVVTEGDPYLKDATLADLFAFLLDSNESRRAITKNGDLREVIMRPVDTDKIEGQIDRLIEDKEKLEGEIDAINSKKQRLPDLEGQYTNLEEEIEQKQEELASIETEIDAYNKDLDEHRQEQSKLEEKLDELSKVRDELETIEYQIDSEEESIAALQEERKELEGAEHADIPEDRIETISNEVRGLRSDKQSLEDAADELQTVIQFNEDLLSGDYDLFTELVDRDSGSEVTEQLLESEEDLKCWTCGSDVDTSQIEAMTEQLRELWNEKMSTRNSLEEEINELETERAQLKKQTRQRDQTRSRISSIEKEVEEREAHEQELRDSRTKLTERIETLETEVEELRVEDQSELIDLHSEASQIEGEINRKQRELKDLEEEIEQITDQVDQIEQLNAQREEVKEEIEDLRTHVERLERQAVEEFNDHMESVLDILQYKNLERIWIERTEEEVREGRRVVTKDRFTLHVVRTTESGTVYEDSIEHLSESEREVTGLIFALAGYLAHEVYEDLPFILLDSIEALDADRISALIEYLEEFADHLVVALLEEDAAGLNSDYDKITDI